MAEENERTSTDEETLEGNETIRGAHSSAAQRPAEDAPVPDYIAEALAEMEAPAPEPVQPIETESFASVAQPAYQDAALQDRFAPQPQAVPAAPQPVQVPQPQAIPAVPQPMQVPQPQAVSVAPQPAQVPQVQAVPPMPEPTVGNTIPELNAYETFAVPDAPETPQIDAIGQSGDTVPVLIQTATSVETGAPRPIGIDPASTGAFSTISAGEGAVITNRDTASAAKDAALSMYAEGGSAKRSKRTREATNAAVSSSRESRGVQQQQSKMPILIAAIAVIAALIIAGSIIYNNRAKDSKNDPNGRITVEQVLVDPSGSVDFGGYQYSLQEDQNGAWSVMRASAGAAAGSPIISLAGAPVALVLCDGALFIPENLENSWDVIAYMLADGSEAIQLATAEGDLLGGQGALVDAKLSGNTLTLVDSAGQSFAVPLG